MSRNYLAPLALSTAVAFLPACTHIITQSTPYYEKGPTQLDPPEGDIEAGTYAMVVGAEGSYVRVITVTGVNAWVWDRAVMSVWDHMQKQDEEKKQREAREKLKKAQSGSQPQPAQPATPPPIDQPAQPPSVEPNPPAEPAPAGN